MSKQNEFRVTKRRSRHGETPQREGQHEIEIRRGDQWVECLGGLQPEDVSRQFSKLRSAGAIIVPNPDLPDIK